MNPATIRQQFLKAQSLAAKGRFAAALELLEPIPPAPPLWQLLVQIYRTRKAPGDGQRARSVLERWEASEPANPEPLFRLVELDWLEEAHDTAIQRLEALKKRNIAHQHLDYYLACAWQHQGDLNKAMAAYRAAVRSSITIPVTEQELEVEAAVELYETAAGEYPGSPGSREADLINAEAEYALLEQALNDWQATTCEERPLTPEQRQRYSNACYNLGCRDMAACNRVAEAMSWFDRALAIDEQHLLARLNRLFIMNYDPALSAEFVASAHREAGQLIHQQLGPVKFSQSPIDSPPQKLRLGYLSSDFRHHSVAFFILPVLARHRSDLFHVTAYYNDQRRDQYTRRAESAVDVFRPVAHLSDDDLLAQIRRDKIDILIDLNGLTKGHRIGVLAKRAAPVQMTWLGYPNTTGLDTVDYRLVDDFTDPDTSDSLVTETLIRFPDTFSVYEPPPDLPLPAEDLPAKRNGYVTFGSFNFLSKLNPELLADWATILAALPGSRLLIKNMALTQPVARRDLERLLISAGLKAEQFDLVGKSDRAEEHFGNYRAVDLCLDSYPYTGTTTTCDSLHMGVPVLTLAGESHVSRVSASQLKTLGLDTLITSSRKDYIGQAIALGQDWDKLSQLRTGLRDRMARSPLMDYSGFTRRLEATFLELRNQQAKPI